MYLFSITFPDLTSPPLSVMVSQPHTRLCFLSRFSYYLVVVIYTRKCYGIAFLAPYTELIYSGSVSDFVTMPLDQVGKV